MYTTTTSLQLLQPSTSSTPRNTLIITIIINIIITTSFLPISSLPQYDIYIYGSCSHDNKQQPNSPDLQTNLNSLLSSLSASSARSSYANATFGPIYGLHQCRGDLNSIDCSRCVHTAVQELGLACPSSMEASVQLEGCLVRYGQADTDTKGVRFDKCSGVHVDGDVEFGRRRDEVMAELEGDEMAAEGFKVSSASGGLVEGYGQCLGDVRSSGECGDCVAAAVEKLKEVCGSAAAGEVFLGHCWARYWGSGYYDFRPPESGEENKDEMGKTVSIIVGVVAGLAVVVVILSICIKSGGRT